MRFFQLKSCRKCQVHSRRLSRKLTAVNIKKSEKKFKNQETSQKQVVYTDSSYPNGMDQSTGGRWSLPGRFTDLPLHHHFRQQQIDASNEECWTSNSGALSKEITKQPRQTHCTSPLTLITQPSMLLLKKIRKAQHLIYDPSSARKWWVGEYRIR